jgi:hypothetical protein
MFGIRPSRLLSLQDEVFSYDLDHAAAWKLQLWRDEREANKFEALSGAAPFSQGAMVELMQNGN